MVGRFFLLVLLAAGLISTALETKALEITAARCGSPLQRVELARVVDGDTLLLAGGERLRVIGIDTPELASERAPRQLFSRRAKAAAQAFFDGGANIGLRRGGQPNDRYGRSLAHVYRADGQSLAQYLLARGLAVHIVVPPNSDHWQCLAAAEVAARNGGLGLWGSLTPLKAAQLTAGDSGFALVQGRVNSVSRGGNSYWLALGNLAVQIKDRDLRNFASADIMALKGKTVLLRGWIIDRSDSRSVSNRGFKPLLMQLRHRAMLQILAVEAPP